MTGREAYVIWADSAGIWSPWVRPVPFVTAENKMCRNAAFKLTISALTDYIKKPLTDCAVIIDLPADAGIYEGLSLASIGMRPVPLYNGCNAQKETMTLIDNDDIETSLITAAEKLKDMSFAANAPPVFLLDSNRMQRFKMNVSVFDNSWDIYFQDMPSGGYFLKNGIKKIMVRGEKLNKDLKIILYKYQILGIEIYFAGLSGQIREVLIKKTRKD